VCVRGGGRRAVGASATSPVRPAEQYTRTGGGHYKPAGHISDGRPPEGRRRHARCHTVTAAGAESAAIAHRRTNCHAATWRRGTAARRVRRDVPAVENVPHVGRAPPVRAGDGPGAVRARSPARRLGGARVGCPRLLASSRVGGCGATLALPLAGEVHAQGSPWPFTAESIVLPGGRVKKCHLL
jgi:hypothetical protein